MDPLVLLHLRKWIHCDISFPGSFPMLLFFFVRIIATLHVARRQQLGRHGGQQMTRKFTSMLLILLGVFFVCHVYIWIAHIIILLRPSSLHTDQRHVYGEFVYVFYVGVISDVIYMLNSSVNCIIYLVYIREFRSLLCGRCTYCLPLSQDYDLTKSVQNASTKTTLSGDYDVVSQKQSTGTEQTMPCSAAV